MIALIDADIWKYMFGYRHHQTVDFGEGGVAHSVSPEEDIRQDIEDTTNALRENIGKAFDVDGIICCFSSHTNFRYSVMPEYKANRPVERPEFLDMVEHMIRSMFVCLSWDRIEADDMMGILLTRKPDKYICCTIDKDLMQVPGWHYNWNKDTEPHWVNPEQGNRLFFAQCMAGDPTDGFKGLPRIGMKTAYKILDKESPEDWPDVVLEEYMKRCLHRDYYFQQSTMARILRDGEYENKTSRVKLYGKEKWI